MKQFKLLLVLLALLPQGSPGAIKCKLNFVCESSKSWCFWMNTPKDVYICTDQKSIEVEVDEDACTSLTYKVFHSCQTPCSCRRQKDENEKYIARPRSKTIHYSINLTDSSLNRPHTACLYHDKKWEVCPLLKTTRHPERRFASS